MIGFSNQRWSVDDFIPSLASILLQFVGAITNLTPVNLVYILNDFPIILTDRATIRAIVLSWYCLILLQQIVVLSPSSNIFLILFIISRGRHNWVWSKAPFPSITYVADSLNSTPTTHNVTSTHHLLSQTNAFIPTEKKPAQLLSDMFKRMCNLDRNSLIIHCDIQQSPKVFIFWTWPVYAEPLCISGPFRDVTYGLSKNKFGRAKNGNLNIVAGANSQQFFFSAEWYNN